MYLKNVCVFILLLSSTIFTQTKHEQIDDILTRYKEYGLLNGSVLVAEDGVITFSKGYGYANLDYKIPNSEKTVHRIGSITKQFTSAIIMQLVEEGKINLYEKMTAYLKRYRKDTGDKVTIHHLLTHTSGIPSYTGYPGFWSDSSRNPYTIDDLIKKFCSGKLEFEPGSRYLYNNSGYVLLAKIIEEVTGKSYENNIQERIFDKIGMKDSYLETPELIIKNRASGYDIQGVELVNTRYFDVRNAIGAGNIVSTTYDLYLWDQALYTDKILSDESKKKIYTPFLANYGYGWSITNADGLTIYSHGGGINGFSSFITRIEADKKLIVVLNNIGSAPSLQISTNITKILYGDDYEFPKKPISSHILAVIDEEGVDSAVKTYIALKEEERESFTFNEGELNWLGYYLLGKERIDDAIKIFNLNIKEYPKSSNTYDSMGEAYMVKGNREKAIEYYKKSIELNPQNKNGFDKLKELGVDVEKPKDANVSEEILISYIGNYELFPNFILSITKEENQLYSQATGQAKFPIFPETEKLFYLKVVAAKIEFIMDDSGQTSSLILYQGGREIPGKRVE
ncbi:MAG: serine hydrolase [Melioribacteraceae bacterium]|nr:serine hydrolase [Melioribacteraceae bacterium]